MRRIAPRPAAFVLLAAALGSWNAAAQSPSLAVGSKNFVENRILAEIMAQLIEARTEIPVVRRDNLGGTLLVFAALQNGEIDLYPEYTGTGWAAVLAKEERASDPLRTFLEVEREYRRRYDVTWLAPFGFNNTWALAIREDRAEALGITRISDLAAHGADLRAAFGHEFLNREDGYPGLAAAYGLELGGMRGIEHGLAYEAIQSGHADLIEVNTTDGKLLRYPLRVLEDDRRFFPPYDCAPVIRLDTLERHPELADVLAELAYTLPAERMQQLNYQVEEEGLSFAQAAQGFLHEQGLLDPGETAAPSSRRHGDLLAFLVARLPETAALVVEHLALTAVAVLLAIAFAVPLGIVLTRREALAAPVLNAVGVIQTVPSLALLAFMIPLLGLGARAAVVALFLYALLPIVRNTYAGIKGVDPEMIEAARGMGLLDRQILRLVELPLAGRTIIAGIRTATVISVGVATLGAFIGAGGLGEPIITGLQLDDTRLILSGAVPAALLAILVDLSLGGLERLLTPAGLR